METSDLIDFESKTTHVVVNPRAKACDRNRAAQWVSTVREAPRGLVWLATSGTTGAFKLVGLRREAIVASAHASNHHLQARREDTWMLALPRYHVGGIGVLCRAWLTGSRVVEPFAMRKWDAGEFVRMASAEDVTLTTLVPAQVFDLVRASAVCPPSLRAIVVGGGALDPSLHDDAFRLGYRVLPSYGLSECASQVATAPLRASIEDSSKDTGLVLLRHIEAKVVPSGCLSLRSPSLLEGYLEDAPAGPRFVDPKRDGWFETSDRVALDGNRLHFFGRAASFIKVGGETVNLDHLRAIFDEVKRASGLEGDMALIARPDARLGRSIVMVIAQGYAGRTAEDLRDVFNERVMPYERVRALVQVPFVPRSPLGKVLEGELLRMIGDDA